MKSFLKFVLLFLVPVLRSTGGQQFSINFDDIEAGSIYSTNDFPGVPAGYGGLQWNNFGVLDGADSPRSGYQIAVVSPNNVAFNSDGLPAVMTSDEMFDFDSAYLTAAWKDNLEVEVEGLTGGVVVYKNFYFLSATRPTLINFDYFGVDEVYFNSFNGTLHPGFVGIGEEFAIDDITIATPEPTVPVLWMFGAVLSGLTMRRRMDRASGRNGKKSTPGLDGTGIPPRQAA